jgi:hypothetical protein
MSLVFLSERLPFSLGMLTWHPVGYTCTLWKTLGVKFLGGCRSQARALNGLASRLNLVFRDWGFQK